MKPLKNILPIFFVFIATIGMWTVIKIGIEERNVLSANRFTLEAQVNTIQHSLKSNLPIYPNRFITPGAVNSEITQENIGETICNKGQWSTKSIRPATSYTNKLKAEQMKKYNLLGKSSDYEEDHCIALTIGGHPTDPKNLYPQSYSGTYGARQKDIVEQYMNRKVCDGTYTLEDAQRILCSPMWIEVYKTIKQEKKLGSSPQYVGEDGEDDEE